MLSLGFVLWILPDGLKVEYHERAEPVVAIQIWQVPVVNRAPLGPSMATHPFGVAAAGVTDWLAH